MYFRNSFLKIFCSTIYRDSPPIFIKISKALLVNAVASLIGLHQLLCLHNQLFWYVKWVYHFHILHPVYQLSLQI